MSPTLQKHMAAIMAGQVTRTNVIGIRKALNARGRIARGYFVSISAPIVGPGDCAKLLDALRVYRPQVTGELAESVRRVLQNPRYAKRWSDAQRHAIENLESFRLVDFEDFGTHGLPAFVPIYDVIARYPTGFLGYAFTFRKRAWQSGGDGPEVVPGSGWAR